MRFYALLPIACSLTLGAQDTLKTSAPKPTRIPLDALVAVVGDQPITRFDVEERVVDLQTQKTVPLPADPMTLRMQVLNDMIDEELVLQKAKELKVEAL